MREHWIGDTKIGKIKPKKNADIVYPIMRFPKGYADIICGKDVSIYISEDDAGHLEFRLVLEDDSIIRNKAELLSDVRDLKNRLSMVEARVEKLDKQVI